MGTVYTIPSVIEGDILHWNSTRIAKLDEDKAAFMNFIISNGIKLIEKGIRRFSGTPYYCDVYAAAKIGNVYKCDLYYSNNEYGIWYAGEVGYVSELILERTDYNGKIISCYTTQPGYLVSPHVFETNEMQGIDYFSNQIDARNALMGLYPITYRPTNCSFPNAPTEAIVDETVVVPVSFPDGYGLVNESNIYVTNNGVVIPSTYSNGQLTFTMPDPS